MINFMMVLFKTREIFEMTAHNYSRPQLRLLVDHIVLVAYFMNVRLFWVKH